MLTRKLPSSNGFCNMPHSRHGRCWLGSRYPGEHHPLQFCQWLCQIPIQSEATGTNKVNHGHPMKVGTNMTQQKWAHQLGIQSLKLTRQWVTLPSRKLSFGLSCWRSGPSLMPGMFGGKHIMPIMNMSSVEVNYRSCRGASLIVTKNLPSQSDEGAHRG